jgi:hypothetical protein
MTKKGAVAARTAAVKRRTFTREFKLKVIREVEAARARRKWLANIKSPKTQFRSGVYVVNACVHIVYRSK